MGRYSVPVWQMVKEAVSKLGEVTPSDVIDYIHTHYALDNVNDRTIRAHMIACSVNHSSAHHYSIQHKFLFYLGNGRYRIYDPLKDGDITLSVKSNEKQPSSNRGSHRRTLERMDNRITQLVSGFDEYTEIFDKSNLFTGPSWYFHLRTMDHLKNVQLPVILSDEEDPFYELLYATLTSWGMHRMGSKGAKLVEYEVFRDSIISQKDRILALKDVSILTMPEDDVSRVRDELWNILDSLKISATRAKLVANSKTLHHMLPNLVPPIDREYTLQFLYGNKMYSDDQKKFKEIYPRIYQIAQECKPKIERTIGRTQFHSSPTKVIDNAIVGYVLKEVKGR